MQVFQELTMLLQIEASRGIVLVGGVYASACHLPPQFFIADLVLK
jgi:hypothetical protein